MGAFLTTSIMSIAGHLGELVGYKAALALTRNVDPSLAFLELGARR